MSEKSVTAYDRRVDELGLCQKINSLQEGEFSSRGLYAGNKPVFFSNRHLWVTDRLCGEGSSSTAYHAKVYRRESDQVTECVIKVAGGSFRAQQNLLQNVDPNFGRCATIDQFTWVADLGSIGVASCAVSECDLTQFNFRKEEEPATFITGQLINWADGIGRLHAADLIHRDIKGANLLVNHKKPGCVTDFGLLCKINQRRSVSGSRSYASPAIWGSLKDQYEGRGWQMKEDDLYAFGKTIQRVVLRRLIAQNGGDVSKLKGHLFSVVYKNDAQLQKLEREFPGRVLLHRKRREGYVDYWVFPDREDVYQVTVEAIARLKLGAVECEKLRRLAALARDLTSPVRSEICRALGVDPREGAESDQLMASVKMRLEAIQEESGILITEHARYHLHSAIGCGENSQVWRAERYPLDGGRPTVRVIKRSNWPFDKEVKRLSRIKHGETVDRILESFSLDKAYYAVCEVSESDLYHFDFSSCSDPIKFILGQTVDWANGIARIHASDQVHRDIKAENLLLSKDGRGRVTDFGSLRKFKNKRRPSQTTPFIADGNIWVSLYDQYLANRRDWNQTAGGLHTKGADLFAFGRTLFMDVIVTMLEQLSCKRSMDVDLAPVKERSFRKQFKSDKALKEKVEQLASDYPGQIGMMLDQEPQRLRWYRFPEREAAYQAILAVIDRFDEVLSKEERGKLGELAELATGLLDPTREGLCKFLGVRTEQENEGDLLMRAVEKRLKGILEGRERSAKRSKSIR